MNRRAFLTTLASTAISTMRPGSTVAAVGAPLRTSPPRDDSQRLRTAQIVASHLHNEPADSPLDRALTTLWTGVFEKTGGALMVNVLPLDANLPGADAEAVSDVMSGRFQFVCVAAPIIDKQIPNISLQSLPYVYRNIDEVLTLSDNREFRQLINDDLGPLGLTLIPGGTFSNGFRVVASTQAKPIHKLTDLRDVKIRVPPSDVIELIFETLGARTVPLPISQMKAAFDARKIEAEENPAGIIKAYGLESVIHWINVTNHMWTGYNTLANRAFWTSLPAKVHDAVDDLLPTIRAKQVTEQDAENAAVLHDPGGMSIIATDISDAPALMQPVYAAILTGLSATGRRLAEPLMARASH